MQSDNSTMYMSFSSMGTSQEAYPTYDSNDLKELEFKCLTSRYKPQGDWSGCQSTDSAAMWSPSWGENAAVYSGFVWDDASSQPKQCQRCGKDDACASGDFDTSSGHWYCVACWRQVQIEDAYTSDEEEDEDDILPCAPSTDTKSDDEDALSADGSTHAGSNQFSSCHGDSSGESDAEKPPVSSASRPTPPWRKTLEPSPTSWAAQMRLRRQLASTASDITDTKSDETSPASPASRPTPAWLADRPSLRPSATSWAAQMRLRRGRTNSGPDDGEAQSPQEVARSTRALLNKLTEERFESICAQVIAYRLDTQDHLTALIAEVFHKATTERAFCYLYAELCTRLDAHLSQKDDSVIGGSAFRTALHIVCQATFERDLCVGSDRAALDGLQGDALFEMEVKLKCSRLGNMRFIGELLVRKQLTAPVVLSIAKELLHTSGDGGAAIESLVALLQVISSHFGSFDSSVANELKDIYASLRRQTKDENLPARIRFLIRDLLDLLPKECLTSTPSLAPWRAKRSSITSQAAAWRPSLSASWRPVAGSTRSQH